MEKLFKKIADAKKEIGKISKDSTNPFFKSKYFDINQLLEHVEPLLEKHKLVILQPIEDNKVVSMLIDVDSGLFIKSSIELPNLTDPQKLGSAITYYRRYTLQSLLSLQAEDDDGNKASKKVEVKKVLKTLSKDKIDTAYDWAIDNNKTIADIKNIYTLTPEIEKILTEKLK